MLAPHRLARLVLRLDMVLFYVFFEFTLIPLFFLIGICGESRTEAATISFPLHLAGSLLTLLGVIALVVVCARHGIDPLARQISHSRCPSRGTRSPRSRNAGPHGREPIHSQVLKC